MSGRCRDFLAGICALLIHLCSTKWRGLHKQPQVFPLAASRIARGGSAITTLICNPVLQRAGRDLTDRTGLAQWRLFFCCP
ncbi:hypothetical protein KAM385_31990 [Aeromonas hydrophila]|nr:hypothetical protein KAM385_31990 [Aeromonas hydrophila]